MTAIVVYALLTAACYYVVAISTIFGWVRDKLPDRVYTFIDCPFCSGFWYGLAWACLLRLDIAPELAGDRWPTPIVIAIISIMSTGWVAEAIMAAHIRYRVAYADYMRRIHAAAAADAASGNE